MNCCDKTIIILLYYCHALFGRRRKQYAVQYIMLVIS